MALFSISAIWNNIRPRHEEVNWFHIVWFPHCIPRHALHVWLVIKRKLKTQDLLRPWDVGDRVDLTTLKCSLCNLESESHSHLFFECKFSKDVWDQVCIRADIDVNLIDFDSVISRLVPLAKRRSVRSVVSKLVVAATTYLIWKERNDRIFKKRKRSREQVVESILATVRLKLLTFTFKKSKRVETMLHAWKLPRYIMHEHIVDT